ncbi:HK97 gp10 family phage protein [Halomonas organivorans]|uniref:HK97 gp10 family phage protein n=1 Tax=Halomonas organivorans TaxID=257772 RepID=A0A7W5C1W0_9GAMM|nr:HK97 gp10 family phage protein [Halomonas organivorans]MBB3142824.1 hypothetical protein [Halomonas organivorans]
MSGFEIEVAGDRFGEVLDQLRGLEEELQSRAVRAGLVRAVAPVKKTAKRLAPALTGDLRKSIGHKLLSRSARGRLGIGPERPAIFVGPTRKVGGYDQSFVASIVETGIEPSTRTVRRNLNGHRARRRDGQWVTYTYRHPGQEADPFLGPALKMHSAGFEGRFYDGLTRYLDRKGLRT